MEKESYLEKIEFMAEASQTQEDVDVCDILKDVFTEWENKNFEHDGYTSGLHWLIMWLIDGHSIWNVVE